MKKGFFRRKNQVKKNAIGGCEFWRRSGVRVGEQSLEAIRRKQAAGIYSSHYCLFLTIRQLVEKRRRERIWLKPPPKEPNKHLQ